MTQNTSPSPGKGKPPPSTGDSPGESSTTKRNNKTKTAKGTKTKPNKNHNKVIEFTGACHEAELKNAVATQFNKSSGVIKLEKASRAFYKRKLMPRLSAAIESKKPLDMDDFVKAEINWRKIGRQEQQNGVTVTVVTNTLAEDAERIQFKKHTQMEQHEWSEYKNFNHALFRILLGQCDEATKYEVKQHPDYKSSNSDCCSVKLLSVIRKVARSGLYSTKSDPVYQIMNEHRRYTSYRQQNNKTCTDLSKDMTVNYDALISLTGELPFGMKLMEDLIQSNKKDAACPDDIM